MSFIRFLREGVSDVDQIKKNVLLTELQETKPS